MRGELITLEPLDISKHAQGWFAVSQDEKIHQYTGNTVPERLDETTALLEKYEKYFLNWMIISNESQTVIGMLRLSNPTPDQTAGESQFLASPFWRKGHMKEAKKLFYRYVFEELQVEKLYADVWEGNTNSIKSLEFYGYQLEKAQPEWFSKTNTYKQKNIYSLSRSDYYNRK